MAMIETLARIARFFPSIEMKGRHVKEIRVLRLGVEPSRYSGMTLMLSGAMALFVLVVALVSRFGFGPVSGAVAAIGSWGIVFVLVFAFLLLLPGMELRKRTSELESAMPFFLRSLGMLLDMGIQFQRALQIAAESDRTLRAEMALVLRDVGDGMPVQQALSSFAMSYGSLPLKRAVSQLISAYETGAGGSEMRKIGDELLALEQHRLKEHSARSAMFGLVFIITSAVLPTFFMVYAMAAGFGMGAKIGSTEASIAMLVVFPMLSVLVLLMAKASTPRSAFSKEGGFDVRLLAPGAIFIFGFLALPAFQLVALGAGALVGAWMALTVSREERRDEEIDSSLPDALFAVSGMPKSTRPERLFRMVEEGGFGALSDEFGKSRKQLEMNVGVAAALDDMWARNRSQMLRRACMLMKHMVETNSLNRLSGLGEDMIRNFQMLRERAQLFAMQKYTLIFGAVLVPLILKITLHLMDGLGELAAGNGVQASTAAMAGLVPPYLVLYSIIAAAAIADAEGRRSATAAYSVGLAAAGLVAFHFINL